MAALVLTLNARASLSEILFCRDLRSGAEGPKVRPQSHGPKDLRSESNIFGVGATRLGISERIVEPEGVDMTLFQAPGFDMLHPPTLLPFWPLPVRTIPRARDEI